MQNPKLAHDTLVAEAKKRGLPQHYMNDLFVHDRNALETWKGDEAYWVLRTMGTHLLETLPPPEFFGDPEWYFYKLAYDQQAGTYTLTLLSERRKESANVSQ